MACGCHFTGASPMNLVKEAFKTFLESVSIRAYSGVISKLSKFCKFSASLEPTLNTDRIMSIQPGQNAAQSLRWLIRQTTTRSSVKCNTFTRQRCNERIPRTNINVLPSCSKWYQVGSPRNSFRTDSSHLWGQLEKTAGSACGIVSRLSIALALVSSSMVMVPAAYLCVRESATLAHPDCHSHEMQLRYYCCCYRMQLADAKRARFPTQQT